MNDDPPDAPLDQRANLQELQTDGARLGPGTFVLTSAAEGRLAGEELATAKKIARFVPIGVIKG